MVSLCNSMKGAGLEDAHDFASYLLNEHPKAADELHALLKQPWINKIPPQRRLSMICAGIEDALTRVLMSSPTAALGELALEPHRNPTPAPRTETVVDHALRRAQEQLSDISEKQWEILAQQAKLPIDVFKRNIWKQLYEGFKAEE